MKTETQTLRIPAKNAKSPFSGLRGAHVAVRIPDYEIGKKWYMEKLDFRLIHEWPFGDLQLAYLAPPNDDDFWVELLAGANPGPKADYTDLNESLHPEGYHHFCLDVKNVDEMLAELKRRGVNIVGEAFDLPVIGKRLAFFSDPFGNLIGQNVSTHIKSKLLEQAKVLPTQTDWTLQDISYGVGFNEQPNFNVFFKKNTGITPAEFRKVNQLSNYQ